MKSLWNLLRNRPGFRWLWIGETISLLGDWLSYVAVSLLALQAGEGALALALVFAAHVMPTALVAPVAGIVADRVDKRRLLVGTQVVMALLMVVMVVAAASGSLLAVQIVLFSRTTVAGFFYPAKQAALRALVNEDELVDANAIGAATWSVTFTLGTALGGVIAMAGPIVALVADTFTFVLAAVVLMRLPALPSDSRTGEPVRLSELVAVVKMAHARPGLLEAVLTKAPLAAAGGAAWVLLNLTAEQVGLWGSAALGLGVLQAIRGIGTGVGPVLSKRLVDRGYSAARLLRVSAWVSLASIAAFTLVATSGLGWAAGLGWPELGWAALAVTAVAWGMGGGGSWVFSATEIQRRSPEQALGRLSSVDMFAFTFAQGAGAIFAGYLVDFTGRPSVAGWVGVVLGVSLYALLRWGLSADVSTAAARRPAGGVAPVFD